MLTFRIILLAVAALAREVAVLFTGQVRVRDRGHLNKLVASLSGSSVVIVTSAPYAELARRIVSSVGRYSTYCVLKKEMEKWTNQHLSLDVALKAYRYLRRTEIVVRGRTDVDLTILNKKKQFRYKDLVATDSSGVHAASDLVFYATGRSFVLAFHDIFPSIMHTYSMPPPLNRFEGPPLCRQSHEKMENIYARFVVDAGCACLRDGRRWDGKTREVALNETYSPRAEEIFSYHVQTRHNLTCAPLCTLSLIRNTHFESRCPYLGRVETVRLGQDRKERRSFSFHLAVNHRAKTRKLRFEHPVCEDILQSPWRSPRRQEPPKTSSLFVD